MDVFNKPSREDITNTQIMLSVLGFKRPDPRSPSTYWPLFHSQSSPVIRKKEKKACRHKVYIFWTPLCPHSVNSCVVLCSPGGKPSVGSVSKVSCNRFSVGREWRALELVRQTTPVEAPCWRCWQWLKPVETLLNKAAVKQDWTLLGHFTTALLPPPFGGFKPRGAASVTTAAQAAWHNNFAFAPWMNHLRGCLAPTLMLPDVVLSDRKRWRVKISWCRGCWG